MGATKIATIINIETKIIFRIRIFLFISESIFSLILIKFMTSKAWAIISNTIKPKSTNLLRNFSIFPSKWNESISKLIPRKIEWNIKNIAEPTPKNKKYLYFLLLLSIFLINLLFATQYWINRIAVIIIPGLNKR